MEWFKAAFGELYPLVYPHRNVVEAGKMAAKLVPLVRTDRPTLDVACGDGRYMQALLGAGVDVVGVDLSEYLLGSASKKQDLAGRLICGDMRALPFADGVFGSAINMFTSFGYFDAGTDDARVLAEVGRVLAVRGTFVLDFINAVQVRGRLQRMSRRDVQGVRVEETRDLSPDGKVLTKHVRVKWPDREPAEYTERVRLYDRKELTGLLAAAGFDVVAEYGDYELAVFELESSPRLILVSKKRGNES